MQPTDEEVAKVRTALEEFAAEWSAMGREITQGADRILAFRDLLASHPEVVSPAEFSELPTQVHELTERMREFRSAVTEAWQPKAFSNMPSAATDE